MGKKTEIDPKELNIFYEAIKGVKPLKSKNKKILRPSPKKKFKKPEYSCNFDPIELTEKEKTDLVASESIIRFKQSDLSNKVLRKLQKAQYNVEAKLDLHGLTVEKAKIAVEHFLAQCLQKKMRVVLIVHGKGHHSEMPVLKNKINQWLRELPLVLAFCSASPKHGSHGAMYILLKRNKEESLG